MGIDSSLAFPPKIWYDMNMCNTNDVEHLVKVINGKRFYNDKRLSPSTMLWKCTMPECSTPPKPQRRKQYKTKLFCNACSNRIKSKDPTLLAKRGKAISKSIQNLKDKWSNVAKQNMSKQDTRDLISSSMKRYCKENKVAATKVRSATAIKNNTVTGFGTSEFSRDAWSTVSPEQRKDRISKARGRSIETNRLIHINMVKERYVEFEVVEFGNINNLYRCPKEHLFYMRSGNFLKRGNCPFCTPKSKIETDMLSWAQGVLHGFLPNKRVLYLTDEKNGNLALEIDLYNDSIKFGIEFHGLFYHKTEEKKDNTEDVEKTNRYSVTQGFHRLKADLADKHGITLLQFFEDETDDKLDIVKSIIKSKLGKNTNIIYARNCKIKQVHYKKAYEFLNKNHLQGKCKAFLNVGLYFEDKLVSILTFRRDKKTSYSVEIARFCNLLDHSVVGGFSKLLSFSTPLLRQSNFTEIVTFSDRRYSDGNLYSKNGFVFSHKTVPDMFWVKGSDRFPRQISWGKTDIQMKEDGFYKIFGAGNILWKKTLLS